MIALKQQRAHGGSKLQEETKKSQEHAMRPFTNQSATRLQIRNGRVSWKLSNWSITNFSVIILPKSIELVIFRTNKTDDDKRRNVQYK